MPPVRIYVSRYMYVLKTYNDQLLEKDEPCVPIRAHIPLFSK